MHRIKNVFRNRSGFTLIELLIVIVIIGILAAIAIPNLADLLGTADRGAVESEMRQVMTDITAYRATDDEYPTEVFTTDGGDPESQAAASLFEMDDDDLDLLDYYEGGNVGDEEWGDFVAVAVYLGGNVSTPISEELDSSTDNLEDTNLADNGYMIVISEARGFEAFEQTEDFEDFGGTLPVIDGS